MNNLSKMAAIIFVCFFAIGCAARQSQQTTLQQPQPEQSHMVDRSIEVEENSIADYTVRAGHATVEAAQGASEAAEDAWDWMREKKNRAKAWVHEHTEEDKQ